MAGKKERAAGRSVHVSAPDGLRLHYMDYGPRDGVRTPVVCLPGLTRSTRDFEDLAIQLAGHRSRARRVLCLDYRGRGGSDRDRNWENYNVLTEMGDVLAVLTSAGVEDAIFAGTSRGGLITMAIAAVRPGMIRAAVLNDIGPVIGASGLLRIKRMLSEMTRPGDWAEAAAGVRRFGEAHFTAFTDEDWMRVARQTYRDKDGRPAPDFDPALLKTLEAIDGETPLPVLWPQFDALAERPVLVVRGAHSEILTETTVKDMLARHETVQIERVPEQGHAPFLWPGPVNDRIATFVQGFDD